MSGYPVPARQVCVRLQVGGSRFLATVGGAATVADARRFVEQVRRSHPDATHHVYAFAVGYGASVIHGMSDDGEPPGTAGRPTLVVLQGADLGDVVLVTTRWFGGTKLGTGGLVRAYTAAAQQALADLPRARRVALRRFSARVAYEQYAVCRRLLDSEGVAIDSERFTADVAFTGTCPAARIEQLAAALGEATSGRVRFSVTPG